MCTQSIGRSWTKLEVVVQELADAMKYSLTGLEPLRGSDNIPRKLFSFIFIFIAFQLQVLVCICCHCITGESGEQVVVLVQEDGSSVAGSLRDVELIDEQHTEEEADNAEEPVTIEDDAIYVQGCRRLVAI